MTPYPVFLDFSWCKLGLELKSKSLLEVDGPNGFVASDLGGSDLALGNGEDDGSGQDGDKLLGDGVSGLGNSELAPIISGESFFFRSPLESLVDLDVSRISDRENEGIGFTDFQVHGAVDGLKMFLKYIECHKLER